MGIFLVQAAFPSVVRLIVGTITNQQKLAGSPVDETNIVPSNHKKQPRQVSQNIAVKIGLVQVRFYVLICLNLLAVIDESKGGIESLDVDRAGHYNNLK